jgi:hypothetical protein
MLDGRWIEPSAGTELWGVRRVVGEACAGLRPKTRQLYEGLVRLHIGPRNPLAAQSWATLPRPDGSDGPLEYAGCAYLSAHEFDP